MNQGLSFTSETAPFAIGQTAKPEIMPVDVAEVAAPRGNWILPAVGWCYVDEVLLNVG